MKNLSILIFFLTGAICLMPSLCQGQDSAADNNNNQVVQITAEDYAFQAPDEMPSGWSNIRYTNEGDEPHFLFIARLPEGRTFDEYATDILGPFNSIWYDLRDEGLSQEKAAERFGTDLPEWFWTVDFMGGAGIIPPGVSSDLTLNLEPGTYVLECYMKTADGELHNMEGMLREITVTETPSGLTPPEADIDITLSNFEMAIDGNLTPGKHTVAVHVKEHPEEGFGHNVHVSRLEPDTDIDDLVRWMNFMETDGLQTPGSTTFAGGMHILPAGDTGYFTVDLEPGRYLFVSEYTGHMGVLQEVVVER